MDEQYGKPKASTDPDHYTKVAMAHGLFCRSCGQEMEMEHMDEQKEKPKMSADPDDYVRAGDRLFCRKCGQEIELWECICGKFGPMEYVKQHIADRWAKKTPSALAAHQLARPVTAKKDFVSPEGTGKKTGTPR